MIEMIKRDQSLATPYLQFDRRQWAALRDSVPLTLSEEEIVKLISNDCNTLAELRRHLPYPAEALNKAIKWLIDNDKITENDQEELVIKK